MLPTVPSKINLNKMSSNDSRMNLAQISYESRMNLERISDESRTNFF